MPRAKAELRSSRGAYSQGCAQQQARGYSRCDHFLVGLLVIPVITMPAMLVAGFGWRSAPRWTRLSLVIGPVIFAIYVLAIKPHAPAAQH
jgi:hypothetical protein